MIILLFVYFCPLINSISRTVNESLFAQEACTKQSFWDLDYSYCFKDQFLTQTNSFCHRSIFSATRCTSIKRLILSSPKTTDQFSLWMAGLWHPNQHQYQQHNQQVHQQAHFITLCPSAQHCSTLYCFGVCGPSLPRQKCDDESLFILDTCLHWIILKLIYVHACALFKWLLNYYIYALKDFLKTTNNNYKIKKMYSPTRESGSANDVLCFVQYLCISWWVWLGDVARVCWMGVWGLTCKSKSAWLPPLIFSLSLTYNVIT